MSHMVKRVEVFLGKPRPPLSVSGCPQIARQASGEALAAIVNFDKGLVTPIAALHEGYCSSPMALRAWASVGDLLGFYSALAPSLLQRSLGVESHAVGGAVIFELYAAAVLVLALTHWLGARAAMLWGLSLLIPSLVLLVVGFQLHSLPLLLIGAAVGGGAAALGYRGSLQIVNQIAPDSRRAEVVSSYLMFCYAGVSLPVIGIGVLSAIETAGLAEGIFAAVIAAIALLAIAVDIRRARVTHKKL
jgi:MFS family permease